MRTGPHLDVHVALGDLVPAAMVELIDGSLWMRRTADQTCVALDQKTKLCTIYEHRPYGCRELQRNDPDCVSACAASPSPETSPRM